MNDPIKNGYINWIDGMKISKDHFIGMQLAVEDRIRDNRSIAPQAWNFGVIPGKIYGKEALDFNLLVEHPNILTVELYQCRAITPAGDRVEIVSSLNSQTAALRKRFELDIENTAGTVSYDIVVKVDSFNLSPYGEPDVKESPPRHPFAQPEYTLEAVPSNEIKYNEHNRNYAIIARVDVGKDGVREQEDYIPPCLTMHSLPELEDFFVKYLKFLHDLEQNIFRIVIKLNGTSKKSNLASNVEYLCRRLSDALEGEIDHCQMLQRQGSPALLITSAMKMARRIKNSLEFLTNVGKDELLNYINEIISVSPGEYLAIHSDLFGLHYDHYDLNKGLSHVGAFCQTNGKLFEEWSRLDYIGKKKNTDIYVAEKPVDREAAAPRAKRKWDF